MIKLPDPEPEKSEIPVEKVLALKNQGLSNDQIIQNLRRDGYSSQQTFEAINQADIQSNTKEPSTILEAPSPTAPSTTAPAETEMQPSIMTGEEPELKPEVTTPAAQPTTPMPPPVYERGPEEQIEEIAESIIDERWQQIVESVGDINIFKEKVRTDIASIKQEILRQEQRFENLQKSILGKVSEYGKGITDLSSEMKALEQVFRKILHPLTTNVKELSRITEKLKK